MRAASALRPHRRPFDVTSTLFRVGPTSFAGDGEYYAASSGSPVARGRAAAASFSILKEALMGEMRPYLRSNNLPETACTAVFVPGGEGRRLGRLLKMF